MGKQGDAPCSGCAGCRLVWQDEYAEPVGPTNAEMLVVWPAPGKEESSVGKLGISSMYTTLDRSFRAFGIDPDGVRHVSMVRCQIPEGVKKDPKAQEIISCAPLLDRELALTQAKVILVLGRCTADRLLSSDFLKKVSRRATWDGYTFTRDMWPEMVSLGTITEPVPGQVVKSGKNAGQPKMRKKVVESMLRISSSVRAIVTAYHPLSIQLSGFSEINRLRQAVRIAGQVMKGEEIYQGPDLMESVAYPHLWEIPSKGCAISLIVDIENNELSITRVGLCEVLPGGVLGQRGSWGTSPALAALLRAVLGPDTPYQKLVGHNVTYDWAWLWSEGVELVEELCQDTMLMANLDEPDLPKGLGAMWRYLPPRTPWKHLGEEPGLAAFYNLDDVETTAKVYIVLRKRLAKKNQERLAAKVNETSFTIKRMSMFGLGLDQPAIATWVEKIQANLTDMQSKWDELYPGVNWGSGPQLVKLITEELGIQLKDKTDSGQYATGKKILQKLWKNAEDPLAIETFELIRGLRKYSKLTTTWGTNLIDKLDYDGVLRPNYLPSAKDLGDQGSAAGRLSSSPNVQNIPEAARFGIIAPVPGWKLLYIDYSAIENRVMFVMAGDYEMLEKMNDPTYDPHTDNLQAALRSLETLWVERAEGPWKPDREYFRDQLQIHRNYMASGRPIQDHPIVDRPATKTFLYGYTYGAGDVTIADQLELKTVEGTAVRIGYETLHPHVADFRDKVIKEAREKKYLQNQFGRIRYFRGIVGSSHTKNAALNFLPQSTVADMFWELFPDIEKAIKPARLMTQVHDAFLIATPPECAVEVARITKRVMEREWPQIAPGFHVPVSVEIGDNWGNMEPLHV